jgi:hypothetical protein
MEVLDSCRHDGEIELERVRVAGSVQVQVQVHWNLRETETCEGSVKVREPRVSEGAKRENMGEEKVDLGGKVSLSGRMEIGGVPVQFPSL